MTDWYLKFAQCHGCLGYGKWADMNYTVGHNRPYCTEECKEMIE